MTWKDYFYFQQKDKIAVILLLILICASVGIYLLFSPTSQTLSSEKEQEKTQILDFAKEVEDARLQNTPYPIKLKEGETININTADTLAIQRIPGIGAVYARRIVNHRELKGNYTSIDELKQVKGLKGKIFDKIKKYIRIEDE